MEPGNVVSTGGSNESLCLIKRFYSLQNERVETYKLFEEGFVAYLRGGPNYNFPIYRTLVSEITSSFSNISKDIINLSKNLKELNCGNCASIIEQIQDLEQSKLHVVIELQLLRQEEADNKNLDNQDRKIHFNERLAELVAQIIEQMETLKYTTEDLYEEDS